MTRRRLIRLGLLVGLAVAGLVGWWLARPSELNRLRAQLDATDPGWRLAELHAARLAGQPPDNRNATLAAVALRPLPAEYTAWRAARSEERWPWQMTPGERWPADPERVAAWRASAPTIVAGRQIADLSPGMVVVQLPADLLSVLLPHAQNSREVCELLALDAVEATAHGDPAGAATSVRAILAVGRSIGREPFFICQLIRRSVAEQAAAATLRGLAVGEWPADALARTQAEFATEADPAIWVEAVRCERAETDYGFDAVASYDTDLSRIVGSPPFGRADRLRYRARLRADQALTLRRLTDLLDIARRPAHEWEPAAAALPLPPNEWQHLLSRVYLEGSVKWVASAVRRQAMLRTAVLAVGCERFRLVHGRWPDSLAELPAELTPSDTTDPYTGRPLLLKRLPDGLVVYSTGPDKRDDGGTFGRIPADPPQQDLGWRLWDVPARRPPPGE